jgi:tetratricopeptide (TPR) repeat protein
MSSILEGYNYDIFISYRQKDNKYDGWVTEFVTHLKDELESAFKEEISVYFDINPHDGLLETHDVDASLKDKLKCLVFIPIVSRTYCDPASFAWEHEFKAFIEMASNDRLGLKVALPNGNVASRILPVRIHDLNYEDTRLIETVLGSVLRGVDFTYKSAGVNRPLRNNEDRPNDNLNKTYYRDQINKVANSVDDIIHSIRYGVSTPAKNLNKTRERVTNYGKGEKRIIKTLYGQNLKKVLLISIIILLGLIITVIIFKGIDISKTERTIALIPLRVLNDDKSLINDGDNFLEAVNDKLNMIRKITVIPRISTLHYRETNESLNKMSKELKTNYILDGNIRTEENRVYIWIELSATRNPRALWSKKYIWDKNKIPEITKEVVRIIASHLNIKLSDEEMKMIETDLTKNPDANLSFISGNVISADAWFYYNYGNKLLDSTGFTSAINSYSKAIEFDSLFAQAYARRAISISLGYYTKQLDSAWIKKCKKDIDKALDLDNDLFDASIALGFYYYYCRNDFINALKHFKTAAEKDPEDYQPLFYMAIVYRRMGEWDKSQKLIQRVIKLNPHEALFLTNIGLSYAYLHKYDSAIIFHQKAIDNLPEWAAAYNNKFHALILKNGKISEAQVLVDTAIKMTGDNMFKYKILLDLYKGKYADALSKAQESHPADFLSAGNRHLTMAMINRYLNKQELARAYFDSAIVAYKPDLINDPDNYEIHGAIGIAYAGLGNRAIAVEEGKKAISLSRDNSMCESDMIVNLAQIYTMNGDYANALINIEFSLNNPSSFSVKELQLDPVWDGLRTLQEYKTMIKKYSRN